MKSITILLLVIMSIAPFISCLSSQEFNVMIKKLDKLKLDELFDLLDYVDLNSK